MSFSPTKVTPQDSFVLFQTISLNHRQRIHHRESKMGHLSSIPSPPLHLDNKLIPTQHQRNIDLNVRLYPVGVG